MPQESLKQTLSEYFYFYMTRIIPIVTVVNLITLAGLIVSVSLSLNNFLSITFYEGGFGLILAFFFYLPGLRQLKVPIPSLLPFFLRSRSSHDEYNWQISLSNLFSITSLTLLAELYCIYGISRLF